VASAVTPSRRRELLSSAALAAASLLAILVAVELALRLFGYVPRRVQASARMVDPRWRMLLDCYPTNPRGYFDVDLRTPESRERYFHLAPHRYDHVARRDPYAVEVDYNSLRFRDVEPAPKPAGVIRVAVVGDSFTEGEGVKEADTYPRVLQRLLEAGGGAWEVVNCGRRGADFPALLDAFRDALKYDPDVVVYGMVMNDADRSPEFSARQKYVNDWILDRGDRLDGKDPPELRLADSRLEALVADRVETWRTSRETSRWYHDMYAEPNRAGWERTQGYLREMNETMRDRGGHLLVASWPLLVHLEGDDPFAEIARTVERFCLADGIAHHDLRPAFRGRRTESLWVHPVDMHPNELAHRLAAEDLAATVRAMARGEDR
jgi:hypothetical protein